MNDESPFSKPNGNSDPELFLTQAHATETEGEQDNEMIRYLHMVLDRKWWVVTCVILFVAAAAFQLRKADQIYIAQSRIKYEPTSMRFVEFGEVGRPVNAVDEIKTQVEIIRSEEITAAVIESLGLYKQTQKTDEQMTAAQRPRTPIEIFSDLVRRTKKSMREALIPPRQWDLPTEEIQRQNQIANLASKVTVRQVDDTKLIDIIVRDREPVRAAQIANKFAEEYQRSLSAGKDISYQIAQDFFKERIDESRQALERAKQELLEYSKRSNTDLRMMEQESDIALTMTKTLRQQIEELRNKVALYEVALAEDNSDAVRAHLLSQDPQYKTIVNKLNDLKLQEVSLRAINTPDNPEVRSLGLQIETLQSQLTEHENRFKLESVGQALLSKRELAALETRLKEQESKFNELQGKMIEYSALSMDVQTQQDLYEQLLSRYKEIDVAKDVKTDNVTIVSRADIPNYPSEPRVFNSLMMHAIIGFLMGCFLAVGWGWMDRSVNDPAQVKAATGLSPLGVIPYMGGKFKLPFVKHRQKGTARLINTFDPYSTQAESFRLLRTNLQYSTAGKTPEVLMVTSCLPSEGKSTVSANLAISFASLGEKVLLIDADLKLPNLHRLFGVSKRPGLSDILTGQEPVEKVILHTDISNLDLMPAGPQSPSPVELLESDDMTELLESLRPQYDRIILDTAPLHGMSDSFVIANKVDGLCLVASVGRTRLDILKRTVQSLQGMKVRVLGTIFNYQTGGSRSMPLYYYYKSGGYGYGYSDSRRGRYDRMVRESEDAVALKK